MTPQQYRDILARLGLSPREAAALLRVHEVTVRKWLADMRPVPDDAADRLKLIEALGLAKARKILGL